MTAVTREGVRDRTPTRYCVLLTGSRRATWQQCDVVAAALDRYPSGTTVLHGDGRGVDQVSWYVSEPHRHSVPIPYFSDMGKAGGPARNQMLVDLALVYARHGYRVVVEAFPGPESRGTRDCIRRATSAGLDVRITEMPQ